ncbi:BRO family protein [Ralstonia solanacearum P673]|uniref:BRO-N domain-containing protein n=1 Tax=Ralstonia solanacearum TaxID=305 RepID=UPI000449E97F|nr:BRO family protein [Ralstonia solanacearum]EUJ14970.1 antirepressor [Ralstonia solanacearum P673]MCL9849230.1 phage antirepressor [Ralstonia solanacearum]MCL9854818.1 phage antirepressor [Ralstonia solanacearum]MCL9860040.1 phage antirepressor [Ralstonia solanacearum]MCL9864498.1 phage antirepressor [Ralstonia solanacearum]
MSSIVPFDFRGSNVRVIERDGEPWFVAKDVAQVLGYSNPTDAIARHCKGTQETRTSDSLGRQSKTIIIPERDVYRLVMRSKLPGAEAFEEWVVGTVLPSIRKSGSYGVPAAKQPDLSNPASLRTLLLGYTERVLELEAAVAEQAPKVEAHDRIAGADGLSTVTVAAKDLQVGEGCKAASDGRLRVVSLVHLWHTASAVFRNHSDVVIL